MNKNSLLRDIVVSLAVAGAAVAGLVWAPSQGGFLGQSGEVSFTHELSKMFASVHTLAPAPRQTVVGYNNSSSDTPWQRQNYLQSRGGR